MEMQDVELHLSQVSTSPGFYLKELGFHNIFIYPRMAWFRSDGSLLAIIPSQDLDENIRRYGLVFPFKLQKSQADTLENEQILFFDRQGVCRYVLCSIAMDIVTGDFVFVLHDERRRWYELTVGELRQENLLAFP